MTRVLIVEDQLAYCRVEGRVIFSYDEDMLRLAAAGVEHVGVGAVRTMSGVEVDSIA